MGNATRENSDDLLDDWVYAESRLLNSADKFLLEAHANAALSRALNAKKLIAVVGSGISSAYGMPKWKSLLSATADGVVERLEALLPDEKARESLRAWLNANEDIDLHELVSRQIQWPGLVAGLRAFKDLKLPNKVKDLATDKIAVGFEVVENLFAAIHCWDRSKQTPHFVPREVERQAHNLLREQLKWRLKDDRGRIEILFRKFATRQNWGKLLRVQNGRWIATSDSEKIKCVINTLNHLTYLMDRQDGIQSKGSDLFASAFSCSFYNFNFEILCDNQSIAWGKYIAERLAHERQKGTLDVSVSELIANAVAPEGRKDTPDQSFLIDAAFSLLAPEEVIKAIVILGSAVVKKYALRSFGSSEPLDGRHVPERFAFCETANNMVVAATRAKRAALPKMRDPIAIMVEDLRIKRFLTTNYDNQFDQYFASKGFEEPAANNGADSAIVDDLTIPTGSRSYSQDPIGNKAEFTAYEVGAAPFLFDFGADTRDSGYRVVHIHGRAAKRESWLVLSERDYRERYARDDEPSARGDDAMRLLFTANPLFFVGLGMDEPDILRPLRAFTQDVGRLIDRPAIALLPSQDSDPEKKAGDRINDIEKLDRYGIYVKRYGRNLSGDSISLADLLKKIWAFELIIDEKTTRIIDDEDIYFKYAENLKLKLINKINKIDINSLKSSDDYILHIIDTICKITEIDLIYPTQRIFDSIKIISEGLDGAARTYFTCSALIEQASIWSRWLDNWSARPRRREPYGQQHIGVTLSEGPNPCTIDAKDPRFEEHCYLSGSRHRILLREPPNAGSPPVFFKHARERVATNSSRPGASPLQTVLADQWAPSTDRFFAGAPSPAFPLLNLALQSRYQAVAWEAKHAKELTWRLGGANIGFKFEKTSAPHGRKNFTKIFPSPSVGRRILFLIGPRGCGRGQMFNAMQSPKRFGQLCEWMGLLDDDARKLDDDIAKTGKIHRGFFNLGLSHEVISVFDRIAFLLSEVVICETRRLVGIGAADAVSARLASARDNRVHRLHTALSELQTLSNSKRSEVRRTLIVIDHISVLFSPNGRPKNAQTRRIYEALTDPGYSEVPLDLILLASEGTTPYNLRSEKLRKNSPEIDEQVRASTGHGETPLRPHWLNPVWLKPDDLPPDIEENYRRRLKAARIWDSDKQLAPRADARVFVHLLDPVRPATLAARFFPRVAAAMAAIGDLDQIQSDKTGTPVARAEALVFFGSETDYSQHVSKKPNALAGYLINIANEDDISEIQRKIVSDFERNFENINQLQSNTNPAQIASILLGTSLDNATMQYSESKVHAIFNNDGKITLGPPLAEMVAERAEPSFSDSVPDSRSKAIFQSIASAVGHNRYAMTVVLAALDDMLARRIQKEPKGLVNLAPLKRFVDKIRLATNGRAPEIRSDIVMDLVLDLYKTDTTSSLGRPLPNWPFINPDWASPFEPDDQTLAGRPLNIDAKHDPISGGLADVVWSGLGRSDGALLQTLQERILIVLAKIGQPVAASVLTAVEDISALLDRIVDESGIVSALDQKEPSDSPVQEKMADKRAARILVLLLTIDLLVHRCLIFRVAPKGDEMDHLGRGDHRFATHKVMRRNIFARFKMPTIDYSDVDQVTVSLYATQPNDLPRPEAEAHRRIRQLVDQLTNYQRRPDERIHGHGDASRDAASHPDNVAAIDRVRLRAAYGVIRSIYSVGVVSRFSAHEGNGQPVPEHGYFESHRLRVRWLLRMAVKLDDKWDSRACDLDEESAGVVRTFHAEEIIWLFNECGVLSLAQGRLSDAASLFTQARLAAKDFVEGSGWGALHARIGLNMAVTDIERGRLREAEVLLTNILNDTRETDPLHLIAKGYLGHIGACKGDTIEAYKILDLAAKALAGIKRSRAAAIMMLHHADAVRQFNPFDQLNEAAELARTACDLATEGGHEDIRQIGQLSRTCIEIAQTNGRASAEDKDRIDRRLDAIADYARVMSMPRLQCKVALARSAFMISEGEFRIAAEVAQIGLQYATRHDMELDKVTALSQLGTAMLRQANRSPRTSRRAFVEAELLLRRARDLAYDMGYNAQVSRVEQVLADHS